MNIDERVYGYEPAASQLKNFRDEIARLNEATAQLTREKLDICDQRDTVIRENKRLRAEIERKRGLLREHLLGPTEVMTWRQAHEWHEDYLKRVREELGDE